MLLQPTDDQTFFRETTGRYLREFAPVGELRRLRDDPVGFGDEFWKGGAELGWTSLLVDEANGGGSISGDGLVDLTLVAHEFGATAAPGPLVSANVAASALNDAGDAHATLLAEVLAGDAVVTWCTGHATERHTPGLDGPRLRVDGDDVVIDGAVRPVESAGRAQHLLVTATGDDGTTQVLVPAGAAGLDVEPLQSVDLTRRLGAVRFDDVRVPRSAVVGEVGGAARQVERQRLVALTLICVEAVGAMQSAFDMNLEWCFDRYSFGRPLASYQAIKHRVADMLAWLETSHALCDDLVAAVSAAAPEADDLASATKAFVGHYGSELMQECVQLHGGIGLTFEHDLHLYLRRHTLDRAWFGAPDAHRRRLADLEERRERD